LSSTALFVAVFLTCAVEALTIVLAAGTVRDRLPALTEALAGLAVLGVVGAVPGPQRESSRTEAARPGAR